MRIDKYIWTIRIFKTRSIASKACSDDKVLLNTETIKPSKVVNPSDIISIKTMPIWRTFKVIEIPKSRVGNKLVNDYTIEITSKEDLDLLAKHDLMNRQNRNLGIKGRPTKKDRRNLGKIFD